jgi:hypothetical protein
VGIGVSFPVVKRPGREAKHSTPSGAEVKNQFFSMSAPFVTKTATNFSCNYPKYFMASLIGGRLFHIFCASKLFLSLADF